MKDCIGQELVIGDYVAGLKSENETPEVYEIYGFTAKKARLHPIYSPESSLLKFAEDLVKVDAAAVRASLIKKSFDHVGQELKVGDYVYGSDGTYVDPVVFEVVAFPAMHVKLKKIYGNSHIAQARRFPTDLIKVDPLLVTMHCLTKDHK